ncbi:MarR family transcriptional regulator [Virgibacillus phasianinus]|uniref:MarR family transcriptional regulator n=1 Tax=Virgibacillus phasianinus TaxID=2017483 RepID=A0A220U1X3_9BACI|nr:MarR family transcriptional regulator [Virgibacillus phasianinus]ASK61861.1 MarR family transcriptional regulator [Virgibacillus phasianinus]
MENNVFKLIRTVELFTNESIIRWNKSFRHNIGISPILVLAELKQKGPQKQSTLSKELAYTPGAMTNIANRLIKEGYAKRQYNEADRRIILLAITEQGLAILDEAQAKGQEVKKDLFDVLSEEEINQFLAIHEKLLRNFD